MWISNINKSITGSKHKIIRQLNFGSNFNYNLVDPQILALLVQAITGQQQGGTNNGMLNSNMWTFNAAPTGDDENGGGGSTATSDSNNELNPLALLDEADAILEASQQTKFKGHVSDATKALFKTNTEEPAGTFTSLKGLRETKKKAKEELGKQLKLYDSARDDVTSARQALQSAIDTNDDTAISSAASALSDANTAASKAETALNEAGLASADAKKELRQGRMATAGAALSMAGDVIGAVAPNRPEYEGPKGLLTLTMDKAYDAIADGLSAIPVWGLLAGGIMKAGAGLGKVVGAIGGGTDGMCVCAGTKVFTSCGKLINIEDLKQEDGILGWDENSKLVIPQEIQNIITPTYKECVEITLKSGLILRCSSDHPILSDNKDRASMKVINGKRMGVRQWKFRPANELKIGNFVALANNIDYWGNKELPNAYLIGLLIGDGTYTKTNSCRLWTADKSTWEYLENNNLGIINNCVGSKKYNTEVRTYRIINGMGLMRQLGLVYLQGIHKTLPTNIGDYSKDSICKLLAGLFDADGSFSINNNSKYSIDLYLTNLSLLEEIRIQLHKLGIFCTIQRRKECNYIINGKQIHSKESYALNIAEKYSIIKFYENIPLNIEYKKEKLKKIYNCVCTLQRYEHYLISGAKQSKIIAIKSIGILIVYNLTTSPNHTYLANGIITHNTTTDAIMGSSFMNLTPWGLVNGFGGKTTDTFTKDEDAFAQVGASYTGTNALADEALEKANKKYGLYSRGAMHEANALIAEAKRQQNIVSNISDTSQKRNNLRSSMSAIHSTNRTVRRSGGYNLSAMRSGRKGLRISPGMAGRIARVPILLLLGGGIHYQDQDYIDRLVQYAIDQNPLFIQRLLSTPTLYVITPTGLPGTHLLSSSNVDGYEIVYPMIQGRDGELLLIADNEDALNRALQSGDYIKFNSVEDADLFTKHYKEYFPEFMEAFYKLVAPYVDEEGRIDQEKVKSTKKEKEVTKHKLGGILQLGLAILLVSPFGEEVQTYKDGGSLTNLRIIQLVNPISENIESMQEGGEVADIPDLQLTLIELIDPTLGGDDIVPEEQEGIPLPAPIQPDIPTMRDGGEINIIPDGALHKELHHMEDPEGEWTRKGIPVVDAEGNQVAEIENSEIIVRKELIESMEEFTKKYYAKEATKEEKEQLALDAGITLVNEILYNTIDKTNKLL